MNWFFGRNKEEIEQQDANIEEAEEERGQIEQTESALQDALQKLQGDQAVAANLQGNLENTERNKEQNEQKREEIRREIQDLQDSLEEEMDQLAEEWETLEGLANIGEDVSEAMAVLEERKQYIQATNQRLQEMAQRVGMSVEQLESQISAPVEQAAANVENRRKAAETREATRQSLTEKGVATNEFSGALASSKWEGKWFVAGGENHEAFLEFEENWYHDYERDKEHIPVNRMINASDIEGVEISDDDIANPDGFWKQHSREYSRDSYVEIASHIPEVQARLDRGESLESIEADEHLRTCANIYFENPVQVGEVNGYYIMESDGRHRILAAQAVGCQIPVCVHNKWVPKTR